MGGKYKKKLREEKGKTKLKGAKLPKGLNITKTEFKIKKIVLREQLRTTNFKDIHSNHNLSIKECISKLQHYNSSYRLEALRNLKDIISNYLEQIITNHLSEIIQNVVKLCLDIENNIRKESFKLLKIILGSAPDDHIKPFYDVLCSYTKCAMSHIKPGIQEDSLLLLDILIDHVPQLISVNFENLFPCFLDMVSKFRNETDKGNRTITTDLNRNQTTIKWRIDIFDRLNKMLFSIIKNKLKFTKFNKNNNQTTDYFVFEENDNENIVAINEIKLNMFEKNEEMYFTLINTKHLNCSLNSLFNKSVIKKSISLFEKVENNNNKLQFIKTIMILIFESWSEVKPIPTNNYNPSIISIEGAFTLKYGVLIIQHIWNLILLWDNDMNTTELRNLFQELYATEFSVQLIKGYPYQQLEHQKLNKNDKLLNKQNEISNDLECTHQNLTISFLYFCFNVGRHDDKDYSKVVSYINKLIHIWDFKSNSTQSSILLKICRLILVENKNKSNIKKTSCINLINDLINILESKKNISKIYNDEILELLCNLIVDEELTEFYGIDTFNKLIEHLPKMLSQSEITYNIILNFLTLAKKRNISFLQNLKINALEIFENLNKITVTETISNQKHSEIDERTLIINLFYYLDCDSLSMIFNEIESKQVNIDKKHLEYFKTLLLLKQ